MTSHLPYRIKNLAPIRDKHCRNPRCDQHFKKGQWVIRLAGNYRGNNDKLYHLEHYVDANDEPIYDLSLYRG